MKRKANEILCALAGIAAWMMVCWAMEQVHRWHEARLNLEAPSVTSGQEGTNP